MNESEKKRRRAATKRVVERELGIALHPDYWRTIEQESYNGLREDDDVSEFEADYAAGSRALKQLQLVVMSVQSASHTQVLSSPSRTGPERPRVIARQVYLIEFVAARTPTITLSNLAAGSLSPQGRFPWQTLCWEWNDRHPIPHYSERGMAKAFRRAIEDEVVRFRYLDSMRELELKAMRWISGTNTGDLDPECKVTGIRQAMARLAKMYYLFDGDGTLRLVEYDRLDRALTKLNRRGEWTDFVAAVRFYGWWWAKGKSLGHASDVFPVFFPEPSWIVRARELFREEWEQTSSSNQLFLSERGHNERQH